MDTSKQPGISFDAVFLKELVFTRKNEFPKKYELNTKVDTKASFSQGDEKMNLEMTCAINDDEGIVNIKCTMIGVFSIIKGSENMSLRVFAQHNAPALLFPYIRETIASTSTKAGLPAILLPPINLSVVKIEE
jgi:preprotein translocase subunit SecB